MTKLLNAPLRATAAALAVCLSATALTPPALAQQDEARMRRMEAELRALQRAVFPNGDGGRFFTPEVVTPGGQPQGQGQGVVTQPGAVPTASALTDVLARLDAIEAQLARLTAGSEENDNEIGQLRQDFETAKTQIATLMAPPPVVTPPVTVAGPSLTTTTPTPGPAPTPTSVAPPRTGVVQRPATTTPTPGPAPTPAPAAARPSTPAPTPAPAAAAAPSAQRVAAVRAIAKPATADAADDEYTYGFRLWEAGYFPEARQQLSLYLQKYPQHARVSFGRNLLGRSFLDDGQPREAAKYFLENYQNDKQGARAPDSLLYLAESMIAIADTNRACIALAEFSETYPALATGRLQELYDRTKSKVRCT